MSFLKGLVGPGVLPTVQETQALDNPPIAISVPKVGGIVITDVFLRPSFGPLKTSNENKILTRFFKLKLIVFHSSESKDTYESILDFHERLH